MKDLSAKEILENILDAFDEAAYESVDAAKESLVEAGYNPEEEIAKGMDLIKRLQGRSKLLIAEDESKKMVEKVKEKIEEFKRNFAGDPKEKLSQLISERGGFAFRKIEAIDKEDALEMLSEAELLEFLKSLDDLMNNNKKYEK